MESKNPFLTSHILKYLETANPELQKTLIQSYMETEKNPEGRRNFFSGKYHEYKAAYKNMNLIDRDLERFVIMPENDEKINPMDELKAKWKLVDKTLSDKSCKDIETFLNNDLLPIRGVAFVQTRPYDPNKPKKPKLSKSARKLLKRRLRMLKKELETKKKINHGVVPTTYMQGLVEEIKQVEIDLKNAV